MKTPLDANILEMERPILVVPNGSVLKRRFFKDIRITMQYNLETIAFWNKEILFFAAVLEDAGYSDDTKRCQVLKNLNRIHARLLSVLENEVFELEKKLSEMVKLAILPSNDNVQKRYNAIKKDMDSFMVNFVGFQRIAFTYLRRLYVKKQNILEETVKRFAPKSTH